jgi:hypothetical protein
MKIRPLAAELFNMDRRTDGQRDEASGRFSNFAGTRLMSVKTLQDIHKT